MMKSRRILNCVTHETVTSQSSQSATSDDVLVVFCFRYYWKIVHVLARFSFNLEINIAVKDANVNQA